MPALPPAKVAGAGFALYSCDGFADAAGQTVGAEADADRMGSGRQVQFYKIRGPKGWVDYSFSTTYVGNLETDYVLGTDRTVRIEHYFRYANADFRKLVEADVSCKKIEQKL